MKIFEFSAIVERELFYNDNNCYGIYSFVTKEKLPHTEEKFDFFQRENKYTGAMVGYMQRLILNQEYKLTAEIVENKKYGHQYKVINVIQDVPKTVDENRNYLLSILSERQTDILLSQYPNIVDKIVRDASFEPDYSQLKGIKEATYKYIKTKILETYIISDILALLSPLGVTFTMIKNISSKEPNASLLKQKLIDNPYQLIGTTRGLTFLKVDSFALKLNPNLKESPQRIYSAISYILTSIGEDDGHTVIPITELNKEVKRLLGSDVYPKYIEIIKDEVKNPKFLYIENGYCGTKNNYIMEKFIWDKLNYLTSVQNNYQVNDFDEKIKTASENIGFEFSEEQKNVLKAVSDNNVLIISGKAGCVDMDTEFFNGKEWKKISEYNNNDLVLQYNEDGTSELIKPIAYIKENADYLWHFNTKYGIDQCLCDDHNLVYVTQKMPNKLQYMKMSDMIKKHNKNGFRGKFLTTFNYSGKGISLSDEEIRVMCMVICDGSFPVKNTNYCRINIKKSRKIERAKYLLESSNIKYDIKKWNPQDTEYINYVFYSPIKTKTFEDWWYDCNNHQLSIICDEILNWDGTTVDNRMRYSTRDKKVADFIQFAFSACGYRSVISEYKKDRIKIVNNNEYYDNGIDYDLLISKNTQIGLTVDNRDDHEYTKINKYKTIDGYKYCFTVPSHMLILRRNNRIFITGNCGKTTIIKGILDVYSDKRINIVTLSAKAARRATEITGHSASTIHKFLEYSGEGATFKYNENNNVFSDIIIVDEASMVNTYLIYSLLKAVHPYCKFILVGDFLQLPPIGAGAIFFDLLNIPNNFVSVQLTKVFRQAQMSGIITDANIIRNGIIPFEQIEPKIMHGELNDMFYLFNENVDTLVHQIEYLFMGYINLGYSVEDISVIVPRRDKCKLSTKNINELLLNKLIEDNGTNTILFGDKIFRIGCRVIRTANDYYKECFNGEIGVLNGEIGTLIGYYEKDAEGENSDIFDELVVKQQTKKIKFVVDFGDGKIAEFEREELIYFDLAYCLTIHKIQGSASKIIIIGLEKSHYTMLSCNLIYTAITRAISKCILVSQPMPFQRGVKNKIEQHRMTFWQCTSLCKEIKIDD